MTRRLLAWSFGASCGYLIGWLAGSNVSRLSEVHRLARPGVAVRPRERRSALPASSEPLEPGNAAQDGICGDADLWDGRVCTHPAGHAGDHGDGPNAAWWTSLPAQRTDEPCPVTLGPLTCPFRGPHTTHAFQGTWAPDRKADADEEIQ